MKAEAFRANGLMTETGLITFVFAVRFISSAKCRPHALTSVNQALNF